MIKNNLKKRIFTSFLLFVMIFLIMNYQQILVFSLLVLAVLSLIEFLNLTKKLFKNKFLFSIVNFLFIIYVFLFCYLFLFFSNILQLKIILFSLLFCCIASDVGGYIFGKYFKGPKLTKISPNKTYSGAIGSIFLSLIIFSSSIFYYTENFNITGFEEKPIYRSLINAGIYVLDPIVLEFLKDGKPCDMPTLFKRLLDAGHHTTVFPMHESWIDIGRPDDLKLATTVFDNRE